MPRDVKEAVHLIRTDTIWSHESRLQLMGLLAANPDLQIEYPGGVLYDATEAAELGEPGALLALIDLKLSKSTQFADRAGGCALAERAASQRAPRSARKPAGHTDASRVLSPDSRLFAQHSDVIPAP